MKRILIRFCVALSTLALGVLAAAAYERSVFVPSDLVAAPAVEELRSAPAPHTLTCKLHGYVMSPRRSTLEGAAILSQKEELAIENSRGEYKRRFPNCCIAVVTEERGEYGEVVQLYTCPKCVAAYISWERRWANSQ
jgi:hypothetical protein